MKCKVPKCQENHLKHYCKFCQNTDSNHFSNVCPQVQLKCKVQYCQENHLKHYCKFCQNDDSNHFSRNCLQGPGNSGGVAVNIQQQMQNLSISDNVDQNQQFNLINQPQVQQAEQINFQNSEEQKNPLASQSEQNILIQQIQGISLQQPNIYQAQLNQNTGFGVLQDSVMLNFEKKEFKKDNEN